MRLPAVARAAVSNQLTALKRARPWRDWRIIAPGATGLAVMVVVGLSWWSSDGLTPEGMPDSSGGTLVLAPQHIASMVSVVGAISAGSTVNVVGPFDGVVREKSFVYGDRVTRGQVLARLDTTDVETRLREARTAEIKARQQVTALEGWANGPEVSRARRALASLQMDADTLRRRMAQTKALLARGIVASDEYTDLERQQAAQALQIEAAQEDLDQVLARGDADARQIAGFDLATARARVQEIQDDLGHAVITAPVSGVVLAPALSLDSMRAVTVEVGARVPKGQTILAIGDLETLSVKAPLDEIDVNKVRLGDRVTVTGDALGVEPLHGEVVGIEAQASGDRASSGLPSFPVTVRIGDLTPTQQRTIRVGMSANLSIMAYEKDDALVAPPAALHGSMDSPSVRVQTNGGVRDVPVTLGISTPEGVEIREGLNPGDVVMLDGR